MTPQSLPRIAQGGARLSVGLLAAIAWGALNLTACKTSAPEDAGAPVEMVAEEQGIGGSALEPDRTDIYAGINSENVGRLVLSWKIPTSDAVSHTPLVEGGRLFFADWGGKVYSADASSGFLLWTNQLQTPRREARWYGFVGTGVLAKGVLYEASAEGIAYAINTADGRLLWQSQFAPRSNTCNRGRLFYNAGILYIPVNSTLPTSQQDPVRPNFQGSVVALRAADGQWLWEQTLGAAEDTASQGVPIGHGFTLDEDTGFLFFTTGANARGTLSPYASSIVGLDPLSGQLRWVWQMPGIVRNPTTTNTLPGQIPGFLATPQLFPIFRNGQLVRAIGVGDTEGRFWTVSLGTREAVWVTALDDAQPGGVITAQPSIGPGQVIVWGNTAGSPYAVSGAWMILSALEPGSGRVVWTRVQPAGLPYAAGFLAGDTYFVGARDGKVRAHGVISGQLLWSSPPVMPASTSIVIVDEKLYFGGSTRLGGDAQGRDGAIYAFSPNS